MVEPERRSAVTRSGNINRCNSHVLPVRGEPNIQTSRDSNARSSNVGAIGHEERIR